MKKVTPPDSAAEKELAAARKLYGGKIGLYIIGGVLATAVIVGVLLFVDGAVWENALRKIGMGSGSAVSQSTKASGDASEECVVADAASRCPERDSFKSLFKSFKKTIEPALEESSVAKWNPESYKNILENRDQAVALFDRGEYSKALDLLRRAHKEAQNTLRDAKQLFTANFEDAMADFNDDDYDAAKRNIESALLLRPNDAEAQALRLRIERLPEVLRLIAAADTARVENDPRAESKYLAEVLALDPARSALEVRRRRVDLQLAEEDFGAAIANGLAALENQNLTGAYENLKTAKELFPGREEVAILDEKIQRFERKWNLQKYLKNARDAVANDDWQRAHTEFQRAAAADGSNTAALEGARRAAQIVEADAQLTKFLSEPQRLSSKPIADAARLQLEEISALHEFSPALRAKSEQLATRIDQALTPLRVLVVSDNRTEIIVRGVGRVGKTSRKMIALKPGEYVFEGTRKGYKSVLVTVDVTPEDYGVPGARKRVTVFCSERI